MLFCRETSTGSFGTQSSFTCEIGIMIMLISEIYFKNKEEK
jgi:hypothetical protein